MDVRETQTEFGSVASYIPETYAMDVRETQALMNSIYSVLWFMGPGFQVRSILILHTHSSPEYFHIEPNEPYSQTYTI